MAGKFNVAAKEDRTWRGKTYDSKLEMIYGQWLWMMVDQDEIVEVVEQPKVALTEDFAFKPDFLIIGQSSQPPCLGYYVDVKGVETRDFKRVARLWAKYGRLPLHIIKKANNPFGWATDRIIEGTSQ